MRSRALYIAVVVAAMLLVVGFAVLYLGADTADADIEAYRDAQGLPPRDRPDRWTLAAVGYVCGAALSLLVIVLMERWWRTGRERLLGLALPAGIAVGVLLAVDGLLSRTSSVADLIPSWYAPLSVVQGLGMAVAFGLAVLTLPRSPAAPGTGSRVRVGHVVLHVGDLDRAARFWSRALGYDRRGAPDASPVLSPPGGDGATLTLDTDDATHLDLFVPDEAAQRAEVDRLLSLGARRVDWADTGHVVLADPDGNLFCVVVQP